LEKGPEEEKKRTIAGKQVIFKKILNLSTDLSLVFAIEEGSGSGITEKINRQLHISPLRIDANHYEILVTIPLILPTDLKDELIEKAFQKIQEAIE